MALETPIASFDFPSGALRGTRLALFGSRLLHQGATYMDSMSLSAIAAVRVGFERDFGRIAWGVVLLLVALVLFAISGPLASLASEAVAGVGGDHAVALLLRGALHVLGALASMLPAVGVGCLIGGGALGAFGWIGTTTLVLSLPAAERAYVVRGENRLLVDFAELVAERVAQSGR